MLQYTYGKNQGICSRKQCLLYCSSALWSWSAHGRSQRVPNHLRGQICLSMRVLLHHVTLFWPDILRLSLDAARTANKMAEPISVDCGMATVSCRCGHRHCELRAVPTNISILGARSAKILLESKGAAVHWIFPRMHVYDLVSSPRVVATDCE